MRCELTLTDVTRMREGRICIAGVDGAGRSVRPVVPEGNLWEDFLTGIRGRVIGAFTTLSLDLLAHRPDPPHTEDWTFNPWTATYVGDVAGNRRRELLERILDPSVEAIFGAQIHGDAGHYVRRGEGTRSLGTVRTSGIAGVQVRRPEGGDMRIYVTFVDQTGALYRLAVTDLEMCRRWTPMHDETGDDLRVAGSIRNALAGGDIYLRIGLARHWDLYPDRCYLQITGIYALGECRH